MQLCDLPDDVLTRVFRLGRIRCPSQGKFARNLPVLAISRRLRRLALPVICRTAYCYFYMDRAVERRSGIFVPADTNMDFIAAAGCIDLVRAVSLTTVCSVEIPSDFRHVLQEVREHAVCWPGVKLLTIDSVIHDPDFRDTARILPSDRRFVRRNAEALTSLFPGVERLRLYGMGEGSMSNLYFAHLADHYAERLVEFRCDNSVSLSQDTRFPLVRFAHISCPDGSGHEFPRLNSETLEVLYIYNAPPSLDLGAFAANDDSPDIVFPKLKKLQLLYCDGDDNHDGDDSNIQVTRQDGRPRRHRFPQLQATCVICRWSRCPHVEDAVFPAAMESFMITGNATLLTTVAAKPLPTTQHLTIEVVEDPVNTPSVFAAITSIMSSMRPCKRAALVFTDENLPVLPEDITFTGLTQLDIASPTSVRTVIGLVQKLPRLVTLGISSCTIDDIPPEVAVPAPDDPELLPPFDTRIDTLGLYRCRAVSNEKHGARVWRYLLLRMPSLKRVDLGGVSRKRFGRFVDNYSQRYPHLSSITLLGK